MIKRRNPNSINELRKRIKKNIKFCIKQNKVNSFAVDEIIRDIYQTIKEEKWI